VNRIRAFLSPDQLTRWREDGFVVVRGFLPKTRCERYWAEAIRLGDAADAGDAIGDAYVVEESALRGEAKPLTERLSKIFRVHRTNEVFNALARDPRLIDAVSAILGTNIDCFLSQFIFKLPGALGQPWHQDAFYFPFQGPPQVGLWLAVTEARMDNGPLWVLPGSHREAVAEVRRDPREHANPAYVEIVGHDWRDAVPVLMEPGDLLVFHSHLMHKSTDNTSTTTRAAMVYHYADAATVDESPERLGFELPNVDWLPVLRDGVPV
jgi:ectoine hydroxylase-related dioxygenase (phytanoyl-CoA dioxygenase family)